MEFIALLGSLLRCQFLDGPAPVVPGPQPGSGTLEVTSDDPGPECVAAPTRAQSEGTHGGTTWPPGDPTALVTAIDLGGHPLQPQGSKVIFHYNTYPREEVQDHRRHPSTRDISVDCHRGSCPLTYKITEVSTRLEASSPGDMPSAPTAALPDDQEVSATFSGKLGPHQTPQSPGKTIPPTSTTFSKQPNAQADVNSSPPAVTRDASTSALATGKPLSPASATDSRHVGAAGAQEVSSGPHESSPIPPLPSATGASAGGVILPPTARPEVSVTGKAVLPSREQRPELPPTVTFTASGQASAATAALPGETVSTVGTRTFHSGAQGQSLRAPVSEVTDAPISRSKVQTSLVSTWTTEMPSASSKSLGTINESPHFSGPPKTTDPTGTSVEPATTALPVLDSSTHDILATSKTAADTETNPWTDTAVTTHWAFSTGSEPHSSAPTHSEPSKATSPMVTASAVETTNLSPSLSIYQAGEEPGSAHTAGLRETSRLQDTSSATDRNTVLSRVSRAAPTEVVRTAFTSNRISIPGPTASLGTSMISKGTSTDHSSSSPITEASRITFTPPAGPSRAPSGGSLALDKVTTDVWEGTPLTSTQSFPLSEMPTLVNRGPETLWESTSSEGEIRFLSGPVTFSSLILPTSSSSEAKDFRVLASSPPASGLLPSTSPTSRQSQKATAFPGTASPEDSSWSLSPATGEDRTPEVASVDITTSAVENDPPKTPVSGTAKTTATMESSPGAEPRPAPAPDNSTPFARPDGSVTATDWQLSQGEQGSTTWPASPSTSPVTVVSLGAPTGSPEMATALKIISSEGPIPETGHTVGDFWKTPTVTVPVETTMEPAAVPATAIASGSVRPPHLATRVTESATSPAEGTAATERVSLSPSEAWTSPSSGIPGGTRKSPGTMSSSVSLESTPKGTTGTGEQHSPPLIPKMAGGNASMWHGSTGGVIMDTRVSPSTGPEGPEATLDSVTTGKVTMSAVAGESEFTTKTRPSTTIIRSTVLSKKTTTAGQQESISVAKAYSSASPWSEQTAGRGLTPGVCPEATGTLHLTSAEETPLASLPSGSQAITRPADALGGRMNSSALSTLPSTGSETLVAITSVETSDVTSTPGRLSRTSSPAGASTVGVTTVPTPRVTTTLTTMGTKPVLTTVPNPEGIVSTMDSSLATLTSTSALEPPPTWSFTTAPASGPRTVIETASTLEVVTGSPDAVGTSFLASSPESGSVPPQHGLGTVSGTRVAIPSSHAFAEKTEAGTTLRRLSPSDTTLSMLISTSGVERMSISIPDILSTSWPPNRGETEALPVSVASSDHSNIKSGPNSFLSTPLSEPLSTLAWATGRPVSSATTTSSAPQEAPLETVVSPTTSRLSLSVRGFTSGVPPATVISRSRAALSGRPDLTSKEAEQSSTQLPTTASTDPGHLSRPEAPTRDTTPYTVRPPDLDGPETWTTGAGATSDPWTRGEESVSSISLNTEVRNVSSVSGGTASEVTDPSGSLRTADLVGISSEPGTASSPSWKNSSYEGVDTSEPTADKEADHPSGTMVGTALWAPGSEEDSRPAVTAHSEPSGATCLTGAASTVVKTTVSTSVTAWSESTRARTELDSLPTMELSSTYVDTSSTTETGIVPSPSSTAITEESGTQVTTSGRISRPGLAQSTRSSNISRPYTPLAMIESERMPIAMQTGPSGAPSLGAFPLDRSATAPWAGTHSAVTQGFPQSEMTSPLSRGTEDVTWMCPPSAGETGSASSLVPGPVTASLSPVPSTLQGHSTSSPLSMTSGLTTTPSLETGASSLQSRSHTSAEILATSEATTNKEQIHPSTNTAVTGVETISPRHEPRSPVLTDSEPSEATSPGVTTSTVAEAPVPTSMSSFSEPEISPFWTPGLRATSPSEETSSSTELTSVLPGVSSGASTQVSRTEVISSRGIVTPGSTPSTKSPLISTETTTRLLTSPVMTELAEITGTTQTDPPTDTLQGTVSLDMSTAPSRAGTPSAGSQGFPHVEMTTPLNRGPEDVSRTSLPSAEATSSPSSPAPFPAMTSPFPASSMLLSSPPPGTSLLMPGLEKTTDMLGASPEPRTSLPPQLSSPSEEIPSADTTDLDQIHPSTDPAVTHVGPSSSGLESRSSVPHASESPSTSPAISTYTIGEAAAAPSGPGSSETTEIETEPMSSLTPGLRETSVSQNSPSMEISTVPSGVSSRAATEVPGTEVPFSDKTFTHASGQLTRSPGISSESSSRPSTFPPLTITTPMTFSTQTGPSGTSPLATLSLDTPATASQAGTPSAGTQSLAHSEMTAVMSRGLEDVSGTSPVSVEATSSLSPPTPSPATGSPSPAASTWPGRGPCSPAPVTSPVTSDLVNTTDSLGTGLPPGTSSAPNSNSATYETPPTTEAPTDTENIHPSADTAATTVETSSSSGGEPRSSVPIHSEPTTTTYPRGAAPAMEETTLPTSTPASLQTTTSGTEPRAHLTPRGREASIAPDSSPATPTNRPSSPLSAHLLKSPKTDDTPSMKTSVPDHLPPSHTEFPVVIPVETVTRSYTSLSAAGSAGVTASPESKLSVSASESAHPPSTAETAVADTLTPEVAASLTTSGDAPARPPASAAKPFPRAESGPGSATASAIAERLPSSARTPLLSATSAATPGIASSPAAPRAVDGSLGAESRTARGPMVIMLSTLETWTQPVRTFSSPVRDTTVTKSIHLGTVTSASQLPPHSTLLTRTDGIMEHITETPREAVHGSTAGPVHVPLPSTSPASLRGLPTGVTERPEATAPALETPSTVSLATSVSSPTSGMPAPLRTLGEMVSTNMAGVTTTTPDVPERTALLALRPGAEASTAIPWTALSVFKRGSETTPSPVPSSGAETRSAVATPTVTFGELETATSWATHPAETSPTVPRVTLNVSRSESDTTFPTATRPGAEVSSAVRTMAVSPGALATGTSVVTSPEAETSRVIPTLTESPQESETTATSVTQPDVEASSAAPVVTVSPGEPDTAPSWGHSSDNDTPVSRTTLNFSHSESDTAPSTATGPGVEASSASLTMTVSPGVSDMVTSQATRSGTDGSMVIPSLTVSPGEADTTVSVVTQPGAQTSSTTPVLTVSPGVPGAVTSLVTSSGAQTSTAFPDQTRFPHGPETPASSGSHSETEASSALPTATASPGELDITASSATHPAETSPTVPRATPSFSPSESVSTPSMATNLGADARSAVPTSAVSPEEPGVVTSQVTSSEADIGMALPTLTFSPGEPETTASQITRPGVPPRSSVPTAVVSPSEPGLVTSLNTSSGAETSPDGHTLTVSPSEPETAASWVTQPGTQTSSAIPAPTVSPVVSGVEISLVTSAGAAASTVFLSVTDSPPEPETTASQVTHSGTEASSIVPTLTVSPGKPGTAASRVTHSGTEASSIVPTLTVSPGKPGTAASRVTHSGTEANSIVPTLTVSPGKPGTAASRVTHSGTEASSIVPTLTVSPGKPGTAASRVTHSGTEASSIVPTLTVSPGKPGTAASRVTHSGTEANSIVPTLTVSPGKPGTAASRVTHSGTEANSIVPTLTVSPGKPGTAVSRVTRSTETSTPVITTALNVSHGNSDTASSMATRPGAEASSAAPAMPVSPPVPDVTSQASGVATSVSRAAPALMVSPHEPATTALSVTNPSTETGSHFPASAVLPHLPESTASRSARPGLETTVAIPTQSVSLGLPETTTFTPVTETSRVGVSPPVSFGAPAETASRSTHAGMDISPTGSASALSPGLSETTGLSAASPTSRANTGIPTLTVSLGVLEPAGTPAAPGEPYTASTEPSPPTAPAGPPESSKTVTECTVTLIASETPAPPETSHGDGSHPTTVLKTTALETADLAATGSGPTVTDTTAAFSTPAGGPFVPVTTPGTSTLASASVTSGTTVIPFLLPFTVNFTITNLHSLEDMGHSGSEIFNATERHLQRQLGTLLRSSSIGPQYAGCRLTLLRPERDGANTRVDAVCTYRPEPGGFRLDRERLYWELSRQTHGVTRLGPYTLEQDSLYINGYNHRYWIPTTSAAGVGPAPVPFTLNFIITNLTYTPDMRHPGSAKFNSTKKALNCLLDPLLKNTSVGPLYSGCRLTLLRTEKYGAATGVDAICTYRPDPMGSGLDREELYQELSQLTYGVTRLGTYTLDRDSYNHRYWTTTASTAGMSPSLVSFTINFTITSLRYAEDMVPPGSELFNTTETILNRLLKPLFQNNSIGPLYSGCRLTLLRPEKNRTATGVDAVCTHRPDPMGLKLDRERLYWDLSHGTYGVTQLGSFILDKDSLYVNGYTHRGSAPTPSAAVTSMPFPGTSVRPSLFSSSTAAAPFLVTFTLNFTITNLYFEEAMRTRGSWKFNSTERILQGQLGPLFKNTSVGALYSGCGLTLLRPEKAGAATGVDALCTYRPDPSDARLDRERLYRELGQLTHGVTRLGPYTLDQDSLYINGHTHRPQATTPSSHTHLASATTPRTTVISTSFPTTRPTASGPALVSFILNFTITSMQYTEDMGYPASLKFRSTERLLQPQLRLLLNRTRVGPLGADCRLASLRPKKAGAAVRVDILCTFHSGPAGPRLDAEQLYWELSRETHGVTLLGSFTLDRGSLYVNGHTYGASAPTTTTGEVSEEPFTLNFTIGNLRYSADMGHPGSLKFNITDSLMQHLLGPLFQRSSLGAQYTGCKVTSLRSVKNGANTGVDILCAYRRPPSSPGLSTKRVFHELSWQTRGITRLGPYSLDKDSLYLNAPSLATTSLLTSSPPLPPEATTALGYNLKILTLDFTISSPQHPADTSNSSAALNTTKRGLRGLLGALFQKSSLGPFYSGCGAISLRPEKDGTAISVEAVCTYHPDPMGHGLDRERLYWELNQLTYGVTRLGPYTLARDSLFVNGYAPQGSPVLREYQLSFRILNRNVSDPDPQSSEYAALLKDIQDEVFRLYRGSQLQDVFRSCLVTNLMLGSMSVTVKALFSSNLDPSVVQQVFLDRTLNASSHWLAATYQLTDLRVTELEPSVHLPTEKPTSSPSLQHFQLNFTVTNLPYSQDMAQPDTTQYQQNKRSIEDALNQLFQNSSIKTYFSDCEVSAFRPVPYNSCTGVDSLCTFSPLARRLDRVAIYEEFLWLTQNGTQLQSFTLDRNSILVDGYSPNRHDALSENSDLPFWAIILVTVFLRKKEGDYKVQQPRLGYYLPHLDLRKLP
ncbi:hypothetical protein MC885_002984 [Smutsia gigantea]|nr:hypothetical protein MC885_002984 [Smutsia gigantea]